MYILQKLKRNLGATRAQINHGVFDERKLKLFHVRLKRAITPGVEAIRWTYFDVKQWLRSMGGEIVQYIFNENIADKTHFRSCALIDV